MCNPSGENLLSFFYLYGRLSRFRYKEGEFVNNKSSYLFVRGRGTSSFCVLKALERLRYCKDHSTEVVNRLSLSVRFVI